MAGSVVVVGLAGCGGARRWALLAEGGGLSDPAGFVRLLADRLARTL